MLKVKTTPEFDEDIKALQALDIDLEPMKYVIGVLAKKQKLNKKYKDHNLRNRYLGMRECHIEDDWLLIYRAEKDILRLIATGTHEELFKSYTIIP